jgi:hypothetical protein
MHTHCCAWRLCQSHRHYMECKVHTPARWLTFRSPGVTICTTLNFTHRLYLCVSHDSETIGNFSKTTWTTGFFMMQNPHGSSESGNEPLNNIYKKSVFQRVNYIHFSTTFMAIVGITYSLCKHGHFIISSSIYLYVTEQCYVVTRFLFPVLRSRKALLQTKPLQISLSYQVSLFSILNHIFLQSWSHSVCKNVGSDNGVIISLNDNILGLLTWTNQGWIPWT